MKKISLKKVAGSVKVALAMIFSLLFFSTCDHTARQYLSEAVILKFDEKIIEVHQFVTYDEHGESVFKKIPSGSEISSIDRVYLFERGIEDGYKLDKWKVNGRELEYGVYSIRKEDPIEENGKWVINISYTICKARPVMIKFDDANIIVKKNVFDNLYTEISTGDNVDEERYVRFYAKNLPNGKEIDKWFINGKENEDSLYQVKIKDAIEEGEKKVITITYTLK